CRSRAGSTVARPSGTQLASTTGFASPRFASSTRTVSRSALCRRRRRSRARDNDLDLVEIAPTAKPPVCRILDYSKYKYEQEQRKKAARKHQQQVTVREMKLRPKIATHDYETKKGHILRFLRQNDKVKVTIMFRGREQAHPERGEALLRKLAAELGELSTIEQQPNQEGRNMTMVLAPVKGATPTNRR